MLHSLLSGWRTALVAPWKKNENFKIFAKASESSDLAATLQSGVIGNIRSCDSGVVPEVDGDGLQGLYQTVQPLGRHIPAEKVE